MLTLEDDKKVTVASNEILCIFNFNFKRLEQRHRVEAELRQRIEQLEKRQTQDDAVLNVVNRYWNQLNEDIRVLLQRFDAETADESENKSKYFLQNNENFKMYYNFCFYFYFFR